MRKLATIQRIKSIEQHPNADTLEIAKILGWQCIVKKGEFKANDLCIYCEIDSVFPDKPEFEFLRKNKFRLRTIRLRGQVSQGLCLPLSHLDVNSSRAICEGAEVTSELGITQYIPIVPACISGEVKGPFPSFIPKTDETRIQILQGVLDRHKGCKCYITEKLDGSSATYYYRDGEFGVCSRNLELKPSDSNAMWQYAQQLKIEEKLRQLNRNIALQGEIVGPGINGNSLKLADKTVYFFNIFDINKYQYLNYKDMVELLGQLGLNAVPLVEQDVELHNNIDEWVKYSNIKSKINPTSWAEGIVVRPIEERMDMEMSTTDFKATGRVSFKVINPEFLLEDDSR